MVKWIVNMLIRTMKAQDLTILGQALVAAGLRAQEKQTAIDNALATIRGGLEALSK